MMPYKYEDKVSASTNPMEFIYVIRPLSVNHFSFRINISNDFWAKEPCYVQVRDE